MHVPSFLIFPVLASGAVIRNVLAEPPRKAYKVEEIPATIPVAGAKAIKLTYGPYEIKASSETTKLGNGVSMDKGGTAYSDLLGDDFPKDITILSFMSEVVTPDFKRARLEDGLYSHHNVFVQMNKAPPALFNCKSGAVKAAPQFSVIGGGATEEGKFVFRSNDEAKIKSGYYLSPDRVVTSQVDQVNYNPVRRTIFTVSIIEYLPGKVPAYVDSNQYLIEPSICGGQDGLAIKPPAGVSKFSINATNIEIAQTGYFTSLRAHMHDGATHMVMKLNGKEACVSKAMYGGQGATTKTADGKVFETISGTSECLEPFKVTKGDRIETTAYYDLDMHPSRPMGGHHKRSMLGPFDGGNDAEQMALMIGYFAVSE